MAAVADNAKALTASASLSEYFSLTGTDGSYGFLPIVSTLAWGLGYFGMPHILLRFMAIEDSEKLKLSRRIATVWVFISMGIAIFIGYIGLTFAINHGYIVDGMAAEGFDAERIIIYMSDKIADIDSFAAIIAGIILAGILAATMSTADSQLLAAASSVSENIIKRFVWKDIPAKKQMWIARLSVAVISVIALVLAWNPDSSVFRIVSFAWAGFGAAFGPVMLFALFWRRTTRQGALAGMISGGAMVFLWKYGISKLGGAFAIYELLPAFIVSCILIVAVSLATAEPSKDILDTYDEVDALVKKK